MAAAEGKERWEVLREREDSNVVLKLRQTLGKKRIYYVDKVFTVPRTRIVHPKNG